MPKPTQTPAEPPESAQTLRTAAERARSALHRSDEPLEQAALLARSRLGDSRALRELQILDRYERTGGIPQNRPRASSGSTIRWRCGRCNGFLSAETNPCRSCGHRNLLGEARR